MAQDYSEYLAVNVLNEQQLVNYRLLGRALKVHSNLAKQMLFEFHRKQNAKKPGTVHATYLITGVRRVEAAPKTNGVTSQKSEDTIMQSSPSLPSSSAQQPEEAAEEATPVRSVLLVKEENLEQARSTFDTVSSIHIYSLEANSLSDVQTLTECNRKVAASYASEDPLEAWKQYGTIQNPNAKRRTRRTASAPPASIARDADVKIKPLAPTTKPAAQDKQSSESQASSNNPTPEPQKKGTAKPVAAKRQSSDIFKSFAKGRTKQKQESQSSAEASLAAEPEDETMGGFSEDEGGDDDVPNEPEQETKIPAGKSKKEREAELQAMMDQEDESMEDAPTPAAEPEEPEAAIDKADSQKDEEPKETVTVENGRRRGRRRIMKKFRVKDEDGYLITKEEPAWESFSEDEPAPRKMKVPPASSVNAGSKSAAKKGGRPPQGNIMSFFGKK